MNEESAGTGSKDVEVKYLCEVCKKEKFKKIASPSCSKLISKSNMSHHLKVHSSKNNKCVKCNKQFKDVKVRALTNHMEKHNQKQNSTCYLCGKQIFRPSHLKKHLKILNEDKIRKKDIICKHCNKKFGSSSALKVHFKANHKDLSVKCTLCNKVFFSDGGMRDHVKFHTREKGTVAVSEEVLRRVNLESRVNVTVPW